jgi:hypothetical protein
MVLMLKMLFWGALKLLLVAFVALYVALVLMTYRAEGPSYGLELDPRDPARSAQHLLVWLGVRALGIIIRVGRSAFETLYEASAEVGEWVISRSGSEVQAAFRSRFFG